MLTLAESETQKLGKNDELYSRLPQQPRSTTKSK